MLLLDKPFVSEFVKDNIRTGAFRALDTGGVLPSTELDLMSEKEALHCLKSDPELRIHTISENSISWIEQHMENNVLKEKIRLFKDKFAFRELLSDLYPGFRYAKVNVSEITDYVPSDNSYPFIIKPNIGFFSMGVYKVSDPLSWKEVQNKLLDELDHLQRVYPTAVLDTGEFIIEEVIEGQEYAIDAYFNAHGEPVLVGVMHHLFGSETDVSDRVYLTSAGIVNRHKDLFLDFLAEIGKRSAVRNFSMHVELRIDKHGMPVPIEINPLRFGAWCTSADLMNYAYNINPYSLYLNNKVPDWKDLTRSKNDDTYGIVILENSSAIPGTSIASFDYDAAAANFSDILEIRRINFRKYPIFCILFVRIKPEHYHEIEAVLKDDLLSYISVMP
jgi:hypothetical protein